jgi:DUF4097 and DUF4098 domain-containing protein YvlB
MMSLGESPDRTFDSPAPIALHVTLSMGRAHVIAQDAPVTRVWVRPSRGSRSGDVRAAEQTRVTFTEGVLRVTAPKNWARYAPFSRGDSVDITIEVPARSSLRLQAELADVTTEGALGACSVTSTFGSIELEATGTLRAHTAGGAVSAVSVDGDADVLTGLGNVRLGSVAGAASIQNSHGSVSVEHVTGRLDIRTASGQVSVDRVGSSASVATAYGQVRLGEVRSGSILVESGYGGIEVGIARGTRAWLDVSTAHGTVRNWLSAGEEPASTDQRAEIRARSNFGDVLIRRA